MSKPQANLSLGEDEQELLRAGAFVRDTTVPKLLREALDPLLAELEQDPEVRQALRARSRARAKRGPE